VTNSRCSLARSLPLKDDEFDGIGRQCAGYIKSSAGSRFFLCQLKILGLANAIALDSERIVAARQIADREIVASVVAVNDIYPRRRELFRQQLYQHPLARTGIRQ
jgi:hypothetical protein